MKLKSEDECKSEGPNDCRGVLHTANIRRKALDIAI